MKLASIFTDNAVLQRNKVIPIWGETTPETLIEVEFAGQKFYGKSSRCGDFLIKLPPQNAGGPFTLKVSALDVPEEEIVLSDILIGDVWLCGGQSNMQYSLRSEWMAFPPPEGEEPLCRIQKKEFVDTYCPNERIRFITVPEAFTGCCESSFDAQWQVFDKESAPAASAVGAWFGAILQSELQIPIGLICASRGGTAVESWTSPTALRSNPDTRGMIEKWEALKLEKDVWLGNTPSLAEQFAEITRVDSGISDFAQDWAKLEFDDSAWLDMAIPGSWVDQKICNNGAVWVRCKVEIPPEWAGKDLQLHLGGIDKHDITFFNGVEIGRTGKAFEDTHWDKLRNYTIPGKLVKEGTNQLAVRAFSFAFDGNFRAPDEAYYLACGDEKIFIAGTWKALKEYDMGLIRLYPRFGLTNHNTPGVLFESIINPLIPVALKGVIWYQGESNAGTLEDAGSYTNKLTTLIKDWRYRWDLPDMPFIQVQLADFRAEHDYEEFSAWARLRQCQNEVCKKLDNVFIATALSTGEIGDIHPQNKKEVGKRMAAVAFYNVYEKSNVVPCGPQVVKTQALADRLLITFKFADNMHLRGEAGSSFYLAGKDEKFYPADYAIIDGNTLELASAKVPKPCCVRYAWSNNPQNILWNSQYPANAFEAYAMADQ